MKQLALFSILLTLFTPAYSQERTPQQVVDQLLAHYGKKFTGSYTQGLAVMIRLRENGIESVRPIVENQFQNPAKLSNGGVIAGRLIFAEIAKDGDEQAKKLTVEAADLAFSSDSGKPLEAMPFHNQMSDAVFMAGPILARAGTLTGDKKYYDQSIQQIRFIQGHCLRDDHLYRHSPLDESAWGRGNGFPAIGIAMILDELPADHPDHAFAVESLKKHLTALRAHQDKDGMWHQVIDHPESYAEFTCTCMISYAILRSIEKGWIAREEWDPVVQKSWKAIEKRIGPNGREVHGACTGTGKQKSLEAYLTRKEIHGYDDRGGSMALLFASEMRDYLNK